MIDLLAYAAALVFGLLVVVQVLTFLFVGLPFMVRNRRH
jgi:hypothetical protein